MRNIGLQLFKRSHIFRVDTVCRLDLHQRARKAWTLDDQVNFYVMGGAQCFKQTLYIPGIYIPRLTGIQFVAPEGRRRDDGIKKCNDFRG